MRTRVLKPARSFIQYYRAASAAAPLSVAFATCFLKGSGSDLTAQTMVEKRSLSEVNWRRNVAFAAFSGAYLGIGQHYIYNILFTRWFSARTDLLTTTKKVRGPPGVVAPCCVASQYVVVIGTVLQVLADSLWHVPMVYLPM